MRKAILASRRKFIAATTTGLVALSSFPSVLSASQNEKFKTQFGQLKKHQGVVIYKEGDKHSTQFAEVFAEAGMTVVGLGIDPVRQWRDGLADLISQQKQPVLGLTNWSDYTLMRGLNAELRRYPLLEAQHKVNLLDERWASQHANDLLQIAELEDMEILHKVLQQNFNDKHLYGKSLFSWVIA